MIPCPRSLLVVAALCLGRLISHDAAAQTTFISNLAESDNSDLAIRSPSSGGPSMIAGAFDTGNASLYNLNSIALRMDNAFGTPGGGFNLSVWTDNAGVPDTLIGTLTGNADPATAGTYTYNASGITLSPLTQYWVVATSLSSNPDPQNYYFWAVTQSNAYSSSGGWSMVTGVNYGSNDGTNWEAQAPDYTLQFSVTATAVPEPGTVTLIMLCAGVAALKRLRRIRQF
jgi:hypothetical protein